MLWYLRLVEERRKWGFRGTGLVRGCIGRGLLVRTLGWVEGTRDLRLRLVRELEVSLDRD